MVGHKKTPKYRCAWKITHQRFIPQLAGDIYIHSFVQYIPWGHPLFSSKFSRCRYGIFPCILVVCHKGTERKKEIWPFQALNKRWNFIKSIIYKFQNQHRFLPQNDALLLYYLYISICQVIFNNTDGFIHKIFLIRIKSCFQCTNLLEIQLTTIPCVKWLSFQSICYGTII